MGIREKIHYDTKSKQNHDLSVPKRFYFLTNRCVKYGMKIARRILGLTQNKEALMNDLILQKLFLFGFALLFSACSSNIISQGRVSYSPEFVPLEDRTEVLHNRYDRH